MRTVGELKKLAYADKDFEPCEPSELCFWVRMRYVYKAYAAKLISEDAARAETVGAERDFEVMKLWERCYDKWTQREQAAEAAASVFRKNPTEENKDKLLKILMPEVFQRKEEQR